MITHVTRCWIQRLGGRIHVHIRADGTATVWRPGRGSTEVVEHYTADQLGEVERQYGRRDAAEQYLARVKEAVAPVLPPGWGMFEIRAEPVAALHLSRGEGASRRWVTCWVTKRMEGGRVVQGPSGKRVVGQTSVPVGVKIVDARPELEFETDDLDEAARIVAVLLEE